MKIISFSQVLGTHDLAGRDMGIAHLPILLQESLLGAEGELILLDFSGVNATASYLSQTVVKLLRMAHSGELDRFFVIANINRSTLDDLQIVLEMQKIACLLVAPQSMEKLQVVGHLEPVYRDTLQRVQKTQEISADELMTSVTHEDIKKTGWLNRLAFLANQKLIRREKRNRELVFKPVVLED